MASLVDHSTPASPDFVNEICRTAEDKSIQYLVALPARERLVPSVQRDDVGRPACLNSSGNAKSLNAPMMCHLEQSGTCRWPSVIGNDIAALKQ